jgi:hypothetical protein
MEISGSGRARRLHTRGCIHCVAASTPHSSPPHPSPLAPRRALRPTQRSLPVGPSSMSRRIFCPERRSTCFSCVRLLPFTLQPFLRAPPFSHFLLLPSALPSSSCLSSLFRPYQFILFSLSLSLSAVLPFAPTLFTR